VSFGSTGGRTGRERRRYTVGQNGYEWHIKPLPRMSVERSPHFDAWMKGDRYGRITAVRGDDLVDVRMNISGATLHLRLADIRPY
jgi:hypothetical protein